MPDDRADILDDTKFVNAALFVESALDRRFTANQPRSIMFGKDVGIRTKIAPWRGGTLRLPNTQIAQRLDKFLHLERFDQTCIGPQAFGSS